MVDIFEKLSNLKKSIQGSQINTLTQNGKVNVMLQFRKETQNITFLTCFLLLKDVIPGKKQKLTKTSHRPLGCTVGTVSIVF